MFSRMGESSWLSGSTGSGNRNENFSLSFTSLPDSSITGDISSNEDVLKNFSPENILAHCFKQFGHKNARPYCRLKLKANIFGPPKSRRRILIAPPMSRVPPPGSHSPQPPLPFGVEEKDKLEEPPDAQDSASIEENNLQELDNWIKERKKLHYLLDNCVNLEEWLTKKKPITDEEENILRKLREEKEERAGKKESDLLAVKSIKVAPKFVPAKITPVLRSPYPESIITLQNLLHKQKLRLMDLFKKADRTKTMKFKRTDFLRIIQDTKIPISKSDLEEIIVYLTISKKGDTITSADLAECQKIWMENVRDYWKQPKQEALRVKAGSITAKEDVTYKKPGALFHIACESKSNILQVPPINTEIDSMHLTYNKMEMVGKRYKEMRRQLKRKTDPLEFAEQCRLVRSGDPVVDGHCLPSSLEGEMGELVDQHRLACHLTFHRTDKLCKKTGIPISEHTLKRGLLYPGDRLLKFGGSCRKLRQPGGPYDNSIVVPVESPEQSRSSPKIEIRKPKPQPIQKEPVVIKKNAKCRWLSYAEFKRLMEDHYKKLGPPEELWSDETLLDNPDLFMENYVERKLEKMFRILNPLTKPNHFWPGHLLDKIRPCPPISEQDGSEVLFSHVSPRCPVYPGIYNPYRNWPVSSKYVTSGDPEIRKRKYHI